MELAQRRRQTDGDAQKPCQLQRSLEKPIEVLAAWIPEHQQCTSSVADKRQRSSCPGRIKFGP